jgi:hypothetical protein
MANVKVREMTVQDAMSALREADNRLQLAAKAFSESKLSSKEGKDALSMLRAAAKAFGEAERHARSAKLREVKAITL